MAEKFGYYKFKITGNPTGILFHPEAIAKFFKDVLEQRTFTQNDLFFHNERFHCFDSHSALSHADATEVVNSLNDAIGRAKSSIAGATHIIVTLGTAWVYTHRRSEKTVANCHKVPQKEFTKELLDVARISECVSQITADIHQLNPSAHVIFTVSPVRHLKDGFVENQRSKSNLIAGLHNAIAGSNIIKYFPSYEIMMDELRDYRFYADDMIHPNATAINYIWKRFCEIYMESDTFTTMRDVEQIARSLAHRPFNSESESHTRFLDDLKKKIEMVRARFPHMTF